MSAEVQYKRCVANAETNRNREERRMNRTYIVTNSILWATAIVSSAALGAPSFVSLVVLPCLAAVSWLAALPASGRKCNA